MLVFRCTQRLAKRFHLSLLPDSPDSTGILGDWYANLLNVGSARLILCLSERTLLPVLLPARRAEFPDRFPQHLASVLRRLGLPQSSTDTEIAAASEVRFAPTRSRQVLGAMNDFAFNAEVRLQNGSEATSLLDAALALAEMPSKPIAYQSPDRVARSLFESAGRA